MSPIKDKRVLILAMLVFVQLNTAVQLNKIASLSVSQSQRESKVLLLTGDLFIIKWNRLEIK